MMTDNFDKALPYLESLSVLELLRVHRWTLHKLYDLEVVRTFNPPQGDWAETLVAEASGGKLVKKSVKGHDVVADKTRIQVKSRVITQKGSNKSSSIRNWDFEKLVAVIFNTNDLSITDAREFPRETLESRAHCQGYVNAESLALNATLMRTGADVTEELHAAAVALDRRLSKS